MKTAINAVKTDKMGLNKAARTYSAPKTTLLRHVKRLNVNVHDGEEKLGRTSDLPEDVENDHSVAHSATRVRVLWANERFTSHY